MADASSRHASDVGAGAAPGRFALFAIDGTRWAVPVNSVAEVHQLAAATPLPHPAGPLVGYLDLRGDVVPVVDSRLLLGIAPVTYDAAMHYVVVADSGRRVALVVDEILGVTEAQPAGDAGTAGLAAPVAAMARDDAGLVPVLDVSAVIRAGDSA